MKKNLLLLLPFIAAALITRAQTSHLGVKGGIGFSSPNSKLNPVYHTFYAGGFVNFKLNNHWTLQPELLCYYTEYRQGVTYVIPGREPEHWSVILRDFYLSLPVMAQYHITPKLYAEAGPEASLALYAPSDNNRRFNFAASAGIGYKLSSSLGVSARYMHGVKKMNNTEYISNLRIGIDYTFGKSKPAASI
ncbi:outer membrane protein with beta-barrel domain [Chitinophaga polysaccharea]|uniref:Outer membrane protein with beta-barrel domain n=1 Tax=Chitinophaga polysaccharea TaxID=1293035 RepID=A0A561Q5J2_9BACT|nr:porin family protein [Chitinophaga polysaccharea]TWF45626.1 outer membrane protein with beta-barrel domain [Chitinophaga polysaccharea]